MGLNTSHDCWNGPYSAFMRWRCYIARAASIPYVDHAKRPNEREWEAFNSWLEANPDNPLGFLLNHSDCEGSIPVALCEPIADALEALQDNLSGTHCGGYAQGNLIIEQTQQFIDGLRLAGSLREDVKFH